MNAEEIWEAVAARTMSEEQAVIQLQSVGYSEALAQETVLIALGGDDVVPRFSKRAAMRTALIILLIAGVTGVIAVTGVIGITAAIDARQKQKQAAVARAQLDEKMASTLLHALPVGSKLSARQISNQLLDHRVTARQYLLKAATNWHMAGKRKKEQKDRSEEKKVVPLAKATNPLGC